MKVSPHGFGFTSRESSFVPVIVDEFRQQILESIKNSNKFRRVPKGVFQPNFAANPAKPKEAGWTFLINETNPLREQIIDAIQPLALHREMDKPRIPLFFRDQTSNFWGTWISQYLRLQRGRFGEPPKYILIIGDAQSVPLGFQSKLSTVSFVGRLDFDDINEIKRYVDKVIKIETSETGFVNPESTFFATDHGLTSSGCYDPTHFTRNDVDTELIPNINHLQEKFGLPNNFTATSLIAEDATKQNLQQSIKNSKPGIFFASCWGMFAPGQKIGLQQEFNGAIC